MRSKRDALQEMMRGNPSSFWQVLSLSSSSFLSSTTSTTTLDSHHLILITPDTKRERSPHSSSVSGTDSQTLLLSFRHLSLLSLLRSREN